ncbi:MAG: sugar-binding domain-containing protein [Anaerolineaceae bacterium]
MLGSLYDATPLIDAPDLARQLALAYGGEYRSLPSPLIVKDAYTHYNLVCNPQIRDCLALARKASLIILGIDSADGIRLHQLSQHFLSEEDCKTLEEQGAVGHIFGQYFDMNGRIIDLDINRCFVGLEIDALKRIPVVIGVAAAEYKADAILAAIRGRFINSLVTDDRTARIILKRAASVL